MKKFLSIVIVMVLLLSGCSNFHEKEPIEYHIVSWATIRQEVEDNLANATQKYVGEYYSFSGELFYISDDASYISIHEINPGYYTSSIFCKILDEDNIDIIINAKKGDTVMVKGKITDIDYDALGRTAELDMDLYEIYIQ